RSQNDEGDASSRSALEDVRSRCVTVFRRDDFYKGLREIGLDYGPDFQCVQQLWQGDHEALGWVRLSNRFTRELDRYTLHPVLVDACLQVLAAAMPANTRDLLVPVYIDRARVLAPLPSSLWSHCGVDSRSSNNLVRGDVTLFDETGRMVA